ncbi:hypothetical protein M2408_001209 [Sphingobacterium sp. BIGb0165]|nr:hypothetical protein [Sphingobacterium sp. BIGb0165]
MLLALVAIFIFRFAKTELTALVSIDHKYKNRCLHIKKESGRIPLIYLYHIILARFKTKACPSYTINLIDEIRKTSIKPKAKKYTIWEL